jgi:hypothetical protein
VKYNGVLMLCKYLSPIHSRNLEFWNHFFLLFKKLEQTLCTYQALKSVYEHFTGEIYLDKDLKQRLRLFSLLTTPNFRSYFPCSLGNSFFPIRVIILKEFWFVAQGLYCNH